VQVAARVVPATVPERIHGPLKEPVLLLLKRTVPVGDTALVGELFNTITQRGTGTSKVWKRLVEPQPPIEVPGLTVFVVVVLQGTATVFVMRLAGSVVL